MPALPRTHRQLTQNERHSQGFRSYCSREILRDSNRTSGRGREQITICSFVRAALERVAARRSRKLTHAESVAWLARPTRRPTAAHTKVCVQAQRSDDFTSRDRTLGTELTHLAGVLRTSCPT
jgi:hypothetical protein